MVLCVKTENLPFYHILVDREEPHQNPNKRAKICYFFMELFTWWEQGLKNAYILAKMRPMDGLKAKIEASAQQFFHDSYSFGLGQVILPYFSGMDLRNK